MPTYLSAVDPVAAGDLQAAYLRLKVKITQANAASDEPLDAVTLRNNIDSMDRVFVRVVAGEYDLAPRLVRTAQGVLAAVGQTTPDPTMAMLLADMERIPAMLAQGATFVAREAGKAAGAAAEGAGVSMTGVVVAVGMVGLGLLAWKLL
jgi:hypothetical protein